MKIVCAYCGRDMGEKEGNGDQEVTHGIYDECYEKLCRELEESHPADDNGTPPPEHDQ